MKTGLIQPVHSVLFTEKAHDSTIQTFTFSIFISTSAVVTCKKKIFDDDVAGLNTQVLL